MYAIGVVSSSYNGCVQDNLSVSANGNNQLSGLTYDGDGNVTNDGTYIYGWNAENEIKSAAGVNYTYDGDGNRLEKSNGKLYWYGAGTEILDESDLSGNFTNEYVFFGGRRIAMRTVSTGTIYYYAEDMLGSSRTIVQAGSTSACYDADFLPFGKELAVTNSCTQPYKFEGKERDTETTNDDFGARYYAWRFGRWLSSDWSSVPVAVPYANLTNPQTLNLYAMVSDNPESFADLDGHDSVTGTCPLDSCGGPNGTIAVPEKTGGNDTTSAATCDPGSSKGSGGSPCARAATTGTDNQVAQQQKKANDDTQPQPPQTQEPSRASAPLAPGANPAAQAAKAIARELGKRQPPSGPQLPSEAPSPTEPPPGIVPGAGSRAPIGTTPAADPLPNPVYMTRWQKIVYGVAQAFRALTTAAGSGENFFLVVPRTSPACLQNPNGCA